MFGIQWQAGDTVKPWTSSRKEEVTVLQVAELLMGVPAPVIYWEQGHEWVFGDPIRLQVRRLPPGTAMPHMCRQA